MNPKFTIKALSTIGLMTGLSLLTLGSAQAEVTLNVDDHIKVTAINGAAVNKSLFKPLEKQFKLAPGQHVITAKYDRLYDFRNDDHDYLHSGNVTVTASLDDNQTYRLVMPGQPESYRDAKKYAKKPTLAIVQGNNVLAKASSETEDAGILSGITGLFSNSEAQQENAQAIAAIQSNPDAVNAINSNQKMNTAIPAVTSPMQPVTLPNAQPQVSSSSMSNNTNANSANDNATLDNFMRLWLQASPAERAKIRQWIQQ